MGLAAVDARRVKWTEDEGLDGCDGGAWSSEDDGEDGGELRKPAEVTRRAANKAISVAPKDVRPKERRRKVQKEETGRKTGGDTIVTI